jgi:hypothetical protein
MNFIEVRKLPERIEKISGSKTIDETQMKLFVEGQERFYACILKSGDGLRFGYG